MSLATDPAWSTIQQRIEEAQTVRGWFVNSYAQIEFLLGAFIRASMDFEEYACLGTDMPHQASKRVKRVKSIIGLPGPLSTYGPLIEHVLDRFLTGDETRNLLAHGFCQYVYVAGGDWAMRFTKWHRDKARPSEVLRMSKDFRLEDLKAASREMADLATEAVLNLGEFERKYSTL